MVAAKIGKMLGKEIPQLQHSQKFAKEVDATKVGENLVITGETQISRCMAYFGIT